MPRYVSIKDFKNDLQEFSVLIDRFSSIQSEDEKRILENTLKDQCLLVQSEYQIFSPRMYLDFSEEDKSLLEKYEDLIMRYFLLFPLEKRENKTAFDRAVSALEMIIDLYSNYPNTAMQIQELMKEYNNNIGNIGKELDQEKRNKIMDLLNTIQKLNPTV